MKTRIRVEFALVVVLGLIPTGTTAQRASGQQPADAPGPGVTLLQNTQNSQAISQTGLLPVFAVEMNFDPSWVDGADVPSRSANYGHGGVNDRFQNAWDLLKPAGFNAIRFALDLQDTHSASRLANLCIWAKSNTVTLVPVLQNTSGGTGVAFLTALVSQLQAGDGKNFVPYTQIAYFQVEKSFNVGSAHPKLGTAEAQKALLSSVDALRNAELKTLKGTGVQATPIMVSVSFDYELVQQGAIANVPLDSAAEQKAQAALKKFVGPLAANANVDAINVAWFPRSISSGDESHFASLLRELQAAAPEKQVVLTTGFSTAFNPADEQNKFLAVTLTDLWDFRLSSGSTSSRFVGVIFEQAFQGEKAGFSPPVGSSDPGQWNWRDKAKLLAKAWSGGESSEDLTWWLGKVEANRGLLSAPPNDSGGAPITQLPGLQTLQQISTTFAQAAQNVMPATSGSAVTATSTPAVVGTDSTAAAANSNSGAPGVSNFAAPLPRDSAVSTNAAGSVPGVQAGGATSPSAYQQLLMALVQQVTPQITGALIAKLTNHSAGGTQGQYPGYGVQNAGTGVSTPYYGANPQTYQPGLASGSSGQSLNPSPIPAGTVSLGPQDVTVDAANVPPGQTVRITAQIHNGNPSQDISGLTVQLMDQGNPAVPTQNIQSGIFVPRSGSAPVQLLWVAGQTSSNPAQLSVQVLDATGAPLATAPVPAISIAPAAGINSGLNTTSPGGNSPSNLAAGSTPAMNFSTGNMPLSPSATGASAPTTGIVNSSPGGNSPSNGLPARSSTLPSAPTGSAFQTSGTAASSQANTPAASAASLPPSQTTGAASTASTGTAGQTTGPASVPTPRMIRSVGSASSNTRIGGGQGTNASTSASSSTPSTRTISPTGGGPTQTQTIQPPPSGTQSQANRGVQSSSVPTRVPGVRTVQPPSATPRNPTPRTIQPPAGAAVGKTSGGQQASSSPNPTQMARTIQPPGATPLSPAPSTASAQRYLDLSVLPADIRVNPASQGGQVVITAVIHNLGNVSANGASLVFRLMIGGRQVAISSPVNFNIQGPGTYLASWMAPVPAGQAAQVVVSVSAVGDANPANNQAELNFTAPQQVGARR